MPNKQQSQKNQHKGPRISLALVPIEISDKEIKVRAELYNSGVERVIRFILNNITTVDAIKTTDNKKSEHTFQIPVNTTEASIKVETIGEPKAWDEIKISLTPATKKKEAAGKKHSINILGPMGDAKVFSVLFSGEKNQTVKVSSLAALQIMPLCPADAMKSGVILNFEADDTGKLELLISFAEEDTMVAFTVGKEIEKRMLIK